MYKWPKGVGVNDVQHQAGWSVYPNPASSVLYTKGDLNKELPIELYDMQGVLLRRFSGQSKMLNIADLSSGLYFIKHGTVTQRFMKR